MFKKLMILTILIVGISTYAGAEVVVLNWKQDLSQPLTGWNLYISTNYGTTYELFRVIDFNTPEEEYQQLLYKQDLPPGDLYVTMTATNISGLNSELTEPITILEDEWPTYTEPDDTVDNSPQPDEPQEEEDDSGGGSSCFIDTSF